MSSPKALTLAAALVLFISACGGEETAADGDFCEAVAQVSDLDATDEVDLASDDPGAAFTDAVNEMSGAFASLEASAPPELEEDLTLLNDGIGTLADTLEEVDGDIFALAADPEMVARMEALDSPEYEAAIANVEAYASSECGIDLAE